MNALLQCIRRPYVLVPALGVLLGGPVCAQLSISNATAPIPIAEDFQSSSNGSVTGILSIPGATIAEDCLGQTTVEQPSGHELTTGFPSNPAGLAVPPVHDGVFVTVIGGEGRLAGMAQGDTLDDIGEGTITIRYDVPQQQVGLRTYGGIGAATASFRVFGSDGSLIGQGSVSSMPDRDLTLTSGGVPIRVVTFTNTDPLGLALDDLRHSVPPPVPSGFCFGDGSGTPCPCGNAGAPGNGCANGSFAAGAHLAYTGPGLALTQGVPNQPVLFFRGSQTINAGAGSAFGDGLRCAGGQVLRIAVQAMDASGAASLASLPPPLPGTSYFQGWYRNPGSGLCGTGFNLTNGVQVP